MEHEIAVVLENHMETFKQSLNYIEANTKRTYFLLFWNVVLTVWCFVNTYQNQNEQ